MDCIHWMNPEWCAICNGSDTAPRAGSTRTRSNEDDKQDLVNAICSAADLPRRTVGVGSSLPAALFRDLAKKYGVPTRGGMPAIGRGVVEGKGLRWTQDCDSESSESGGGGTVTAKGLSTILAALTQG